MRIRQELVGKEQRTDYGTLCSLERHARLVDHLCSGWLCSPNLTNGQAKGSLTQARASSKAKDCYHVTSRNGNAHGDSVPLHYESPAYIATEVSVAT